jgi:hypothetical protein
MRSRGLFRAAPAGRPLGAQAQAAQPAIDLATAKAQQWAQMKVARRAALQAPLVTPYGTFDADPESRDNIVQTAHLMQTEAQTLAPDQVPSVDFTLADNTAVNLTAGQMVDVALLLAAQIQQAYSRGRQVRAAIDAATTTAQVAAITWSTSHERFRAPLSHGHGQAPGPHGDARGGSGDRSRSVLRAGPRRGSGALRAHRARRVRDPGGALSDVQEELHPLHVLHYAETERHRRGIALAPKYDRVRAMERAGAWCSSPPDA